MFFCSNPFFSAIPVTRSDSASSFAGSAPASHTVHNESSDNEESSSTSEEEEAVLAGKGSHIAKKPSGPPKKPLPTVPVEPKGEDEDDYSEEGVVQWG